MDASRFDRISKLFAQRRRPRQALAQEATPAAPDRPGRAPELLFVQSFRAGAITRKEGADGRYTLALEAGLGQTIYFSDRPDRVVGATPTGDFLDRLGFPGDDPPNAALVVETAPGETDVAVVELFSPVYDEGTGGITYEIEVLANWQAELELGFFEAPSDLGSLEPTFGAAHLFIDGIADCPDARMYCVPNQCDVEHSSVDATGCELFGIIANSEHDGFCRSFLGDCLPCDPWLGAYQPDVVGYWSGECNRRFPACQNNCRPFSVNSLRP